MIQANNVTVQFGGRALFERVNVTFSKGNCYGFIGANGAGKSTFLKVLDGELEPQKGEVVITPGERLSVLKQDHFAYDQYQVVRTVLMGNPRLIEIMEEKDALYAKPDLARRMACAPGSWKRNLPIWTAGTQKATRSLCSTSWVSPTSTTI